MNRQIFLNTHFEHVSAEICCIMFPHNRFLDVPQLTILVTLALLAVPLKLHLQNCHFASVLGPEKISGSYSQCHRTNLYFASVVCVCIEHVCVGGEGGGFTDLMTFFFSYQRSNAFHCLIFLSLHFLSYTISIHDRHNARAHTRTSQ